MNCKARLSTPISFVTEREPVAPSEFHIIDTISDHRLHSELERSSRLINRSAKEYNVPLYTRNLALFIYLRGLVREYWLAEKRC